MTTTPTSVTLTQVRMEGLYRGLLVWGGVMVVTAPLVAWAVFILPGW
jgi:hypothetical protein